MVLKDLLLSTLRKSSAWSNFVDVLESTQHSGSKFISGDFTSALGQISDYSTVKTLLINEATLKVSGSASSDSNIFYIKALEPLTLCLVAEAPSASSIQDCNIPKLDYKLDDASYAPVQFVLDAHQAIAAWSLDTNSVIRFKSRVESSSFSSSSYSDTIENLFKCQFTTTTPSSPRIESGGNLLSLLSPSLREVAPSPCCFYELFDNQKLTLTTGPYYTGSILSPYIFYGLFQYSALTSPAFNLTWDNVPDGAYSNLYNKSSLQTCPHIKGSVVGKKAFQSAFSLTPLSEAKVEGFYEVSYQSFNACFSGSRLKSLEMSPSVLGPQSYDNLVSDCSDLVRLKVHFTDWNSDYKSTHYWMTGCSSTGTFICPEALPEERSGDPSQDYEISYIPADWTIERF